MDYLRLQCIRRALFYSIEEAALYIGACTPLHWEKFEAGVIPVPSELFVLLDWLAKSRRVFVAEYQKYRVLYRELTGEYKPFAATWFERECDFKTVYAEDGLQWRPYCSAIAEVIERDQQTPIIVFNRKAYDEFCESAKAVDLYRQGIPAIWSYAQFAKDHGPKLQRRNQTGE